ncbi:MAG: hypothetical protein ACRDXC_06705 [Acidimicrobiales bacterium]
MSVATQQMTARGTARGTEQTAAVPRLVPAESVIAARPAVPVSVLLLGVVAVLVAAWGAAAPFAGPSFGYVADRVVAWQWSTTSACLGLGPGVVALVASLCVIAMATRRSYARRADLWILGLVVTSCGAWFVVGQYVWPVVYGSHFIAPAGASLFMWKELAFAIGPGVILTFCGATFMGWAVRRQLALVAAQVPPVVVSEVPVTVPAGTTVTGSAPAPRSLKALDVDPAMESTGTMAPPVATPVAEPASEVDEVEPDHGDPPGDPDATETLGPPAEGTDAAR